MSIFWGVFCGAFVAIAAAWMWSVILHFFLGEKFKCCFACSMRQLPGLIFFWLMVRSLPNITDERLRQQVSDALVAVKEKFSRE